MQDEVKSTRATKAPEMLRQTQARYPGSGLGEAQWDDFLLIYKGDVDKALLSYIARADQEIAKINGHPSSPGDPNIPLIPDGIDLSTLPLSVIKAEMTRLEQFISADTLIRNQYAGALGTHLSGEQHAQRSGISSDGCRWCGGKAKAAANGARNDVWPIV